MCLPTPSAVFPDPPLTVEKLPGNSVRRHASIETAWTEFIALVAKDVDRRGRQTYTLCSGLQGVAPRQGTGSKSVWPGSAEKTPLKGRPHHEPLESSLMANVTPCSLPPLGTSRRGKRNPKRRVRQRDRRDERRRGRELDPWASPDDDGSCDHWVAARISGASAAW